jgi:peptidoglycan/xylan/chitin deacetylase (PgdA/CDA1 family)
MYHVLEAAPAGAPYPELYVRSEDFRAQLAWLARHGFQAVTLRRVYDAWRGRATLPKRPVVLTFDDGYRSVYSVGLPALRRHGWVGVLNLAVEHQWTDLPPRLVWQLRTAGWELDDHTFTHPDLTGLDHAALEREIAGSRAFLRKQYRVPVDFFCYPAGRYDDRVIAAVRKAGYLGATTTNYGLARPSDGLFTLRRVRVQGSDGLAGFVSRLRSLTG